MLLLTLLLLAHLPISVIPSLIAKQSMGDIYVLASSFETSVFHCCTSRAAYKSSDASDSSVSEKRLKNPHPCSFSTQTCFLRASMTALYSCSLCDSYPLYPFSNSAPPASRRSPRCSCAPFAARSGHCMQLLLKQALERVLLSLMSNSFAWCVVQLGVTRTAVVGARRRLSMSAQVCIPHH
jgi:hypothetical protein